MITGRLTESARLAWINCGIAMSMFATALPATANAGQCERSATFWSNKSAIIYFTVETDVRNLSTSQAVDDMRILMIGEGAKITLYNDKEGRITGEIPDRGAPFQPPFYNFSVTQNNSIARLRLVYSRSLKDAPQSMRKSKAKICWMILQVKPKP
jgi:hypothetical protein